MIEDMPKFELYDEVTVKSSYWLSGRTQVIRDIEYDDRKHKFLYFFEGTHFTAWEDQMEKVISDE